MASEEYSSAQCKHYDICGRNVEGDPVAGLCILHSTDRAKDTHAFAEALDAHRKKGDNFVSFVFPASGADFAGARFSRRASFYEATFNGKASFTGAVFRGEANFYKATFNEEADFAGARFTKKVEFDRARFNKRAYFAGVRFRGEASFTGVTFITSVVCRGARFNKEADFAGARFNGKASFIWATFRGEAGFARAEFIEDASFIRVTFTKGVDCTGAAFTKGVDCTGAAFTKGVAFDGAMFSGYVRFYQATFSGRTRFAGQLRSAKAAGLIFADTAVDFRQVVIDPPDAVTFLEADLTKCRFQDTDLRKVQLVDIKWPEKGQRVVVYDEIVLCQSADTNTRPWPQIERLYRELKQNHEDRRDYERAGDFHYGEKEMRRKNPDTAYTAWGLRFFLTLYWLFSGYGERYLRPLLWAGLLFAGSTFGYMWWGLRPKDGGSSLVWTNDGWDLLGGLSLAWTKGWDWLQAAYYSFRVMTFLKPDDWVPVGYAHVINTFQTLLSPLFLGLFALALRQRLKR